MRAQAIKAADGTQFLTLPKAVSTPTRVVAPQRMPKSHAQFRGEGQKERLARLHIALVERTAQ